VHCSLHNLNRGIVAHLHHCVCWQRDLWQAEGSRVWSLAGSGDLEHGNHWEAQVLGSTSWSVCSEAEVDVEECGLMALEPSGLNGNSSAGEWPERAIRCDWMSSTLVLLDPSHVE
jgi:hypothetical protein